MKAVVNFAIVQKYSPSHIQSEFVLSMFASFVELFNYSSNNGMFVI